MNKKAPDGYHVLLPGHRPDDWTVESPFKDNDIVVFDGTCQSDDAQVYPAIMVSDSGENARVDLSYEFVKLAYFEALNSRKDHFPKIPYLGFYQNNDHGEKCISRMISSSVKSGETHANNPVCVHLVLTDDYNVRPGFQYKEAFEEDALDLERSITSAGISEFSFYVRTLNLNTYLQKISHQFNVGICLPFDSKEIEFHPGIHRMYQDIWVEKKYATQVRPGSRNVKL